MLIIILMLINLLYYAYYSTYADKITIIIIIHPWMLYINRVYIFTYPYIPIYIYIYIYLHTFGDYTPLVTIPILIESINNYSYIYITIQYL